MTRDEMQELKRLAEESREAIRELGFFPDPTRMDFHIAANPVAVLSLIARIEELEGK